MRANTYRQNGCNRGGTDHVLQLADKLPPALAGSLAVELVDREQGRAAALAPILASRGFPVQVSAKPAPLSSKVTVDVYAVDDAEVPARALENPSMSPLLEVALLVSVPTIESAGGAVVAIAATVTPDAAAVRDGIRVILSRIEALAPGRRSSALMAARGIHAEQMPRARHAAHDRLTTRSATFLTSGRVEPELAMVDGFTGTAYQLSVVEARRDDRRRVLRQATLNEILPEIRDNGDRRGVVFHERQDPWLYVVLARQRAGRWHLDRAIELPVLRLRPDEEPVEAPTFITD